ncbi:MAG: HigA family addiction module antidote protein [Blastomonas sp.]|jgi:addiction module HigA family antidote|uniref:HigA family addiction module antitoxin n=2 Tax=Sphingomonadaceae TaxID=41297 RepID=UPI0006B8D850|nr:HigA family addiction module antitoxin [Blastomonas fulva]KPF74920.1 XRE family transcriptional regulator [Blastomonas sp. AAP25]MCO5791646.1 HigA family addiction module antidote protein [Blastomonas sp.]MDK2758321.1 HigA family addiction module antidote protein [Blastomonas fulva]MDM7965815.1 HigA family addiction module antitoxin [Blastomonas fulva]
MMKTPPHPGTMLRDDVIVPLGLGVTETARKLGMSRVALSRVINGRAAISPDLAIRLERAGVSTARFWIGLQANYDLAMALEHSQPTVEPLQTAA